MALVPYTSGDFLALLKGEVSGVGDLQQARALAKGAAALFRKVDALRAVQNEDSPGLGVWTIATGTNFEIVRVLRVEFHADEGFTRPVQILASDIAAGDALINRGESSDIVEWNAARRPDAGPETIPARLFYTLTPRVPSLRDLQDPEKSQLFGLDEKLLSDFERGLRAAAIVEGTLESYLSANAMIARSRTPGGWRGDYAGEVTELAMRFGADASGKPTQRFEAFGPQGGGSPLFFGDGYYEGAGRTDQGQDYPVLRFNPETGRTEVVPRGTPA